MRRIISVLVILFFIVSCSTQVKKTSYQKKQDWEYYYKLGISYINTGDNSRALSYLTKAYNLNPTNPDILNALGIVNAAIGNIDKAEDIFKKAIEYAPDKGEAYTNLGALLAQSKRYDEAISFLEKAISISSYYEKEKAYYNLALVYKKIGEMDKYEKYMLKAISYRVTFLPAYISLSNYLVAKKRFLEAKDILLRALNYGLENPYLYLNLGKVYYATGNVEKAKEFLKKAYKTAGKDVFVKEESEKLLQHIALKKPYPLGAMNRLYKPSEEATNITEEVQKEKKNNKTQETLLKEEKESKDNFKFFIQVGVFSSSKKAVSFANQLITNGFEPEIKEKVVAGKVYYYVIIGYFKNYLNAYEFLNEKLKRKGINGIIKFERL